tara:strand:+ start:1008 stop:1388 length:381 start_codon:yes stop_codon:yes gene_type:complete
MLKIDLSAPEPAYIQIVAQIGLAISKGELSEGDQLPPIRQLASDLEVNANTVAKAYLLLEENQLIITKGRSGSYINLEAYDYYQDWLKHEVKKELLSSWNKLLSLSHSRSLSKKIWNDAFKELKDE